jgi:Protein of unknown function (DUF4197)
MTKFSKRLKPLAFIALGLAATAPVAAPLSAEALNIFSSLKGVLGNASDNALGKLSQPGAFYADQAVRIVLPGTGGKLASKVMKLGDKAGLTNKLTKSLNDAAGLAANEAKPVFRAAIDNMSISDVPGLATKSDGATQYLKQSAGSELRIKVRPLVASALGKVGAFNQLGKLGNTSGLLGKVGLNNDGLTDSVTDQTLKGIYSYMGSEEAKLRANPVKTGKALLDIIN